MKRKRRKHSRALFLLLLIAAPIAFAAAMQASAPGTVSFTGKIVSLDSNASATYVQPVITNGTTQYVVKSAVTGHTLATFSNEKDAETFASRVSPTTAANH